MTEQAEQLTWWANLADIPETPPIPAGLIPRPASPADIESLASIIELMVRPDFRRRGLAEFLVRSAASTLRAQGEKVVGLRVMSNNTPAIRLYSKLGFK